MVAHEPNLQPHLDIANPLFPGIKQIALCHAMTLTVASLILMFFPGVTTTTRITIANMEHRQTNIIIHRPHSVNSNT